MPSSTTTATYFLLFVPSPFPFHIYIFTAETKEKPKKNLKQISFVILSGEIIHHPSVPSVPSQSTKLKLLLFAVVLYTQVAAAAASAEVNIGDWLDAETAVGEWLAI